MLPLLAPKTWESKSDLLAHLATDGSRALLLGEDTEAPRVYYSFSIPSASGQGSAEIGIISSGLGTAVAAVLSSHGRAFVGHDTWITLLEIDTPAVITSKRLGGVFYEFLPIDGEDEIVVLHEIGLLRVDWNAAVQWSVDSDVVEARTTDGRGNVVLSVMDGPPLVVSLASGAVRRV